MDLKIYIDRLKDGTVEKFSTQAPATLLDLQENDLKCQGSIEVKAEAYLADDHLITTLTAKATLLMPCSICNQMTEVPIQIDESTHAEPVSTIKGAIFDLSELLREDILIRVPQFVECNHGHCPEREEIKKYLHRKKDEGKSAEASQVYYPFSEL